MTRSAPATRGGVGGDVDPGERRVALVGRQATLRDRPIEVARDPLAAGLGAGQVRLVERDRQPDRGVDLGDAMTHQTRPATNTRSIVPGMVRMVRGRRGAVRGGALRPPVRDRDRDLASRSLVAIGAAVVAAVRAAVTAVGLVGLVGAAAPSWLDGGESRSSERSLAAGPIIIAVVLGGGSALAAVRAAAGLRPARCGPGDGHDRRDDQLRARAWTTRLARRGRLARVAGDASRILGLRSGRIRRRSGHDQSRGHLVDGRRGRERPGPKHRRDAEDERQRTCPDRRARRASRERSPDARRPTASPRRIARNGSGRPTGRIASVSEAGHRRSLPSHGPRTHPGRVATTPQIGS